MRKKQFPDYGFGYRKPNPACPAGRQAAGRRGPLASGIYAIIDAQACGLRPLAKIARDCLTSGIKIIQYRDKTEDIRGFYQNALLLKKVIGPKALFIINDRADIARLVCADGLHLGQDDLPVAAARKIIGVNKIIGKSCHSLKQAILAQKEGADYISIGPIFKTPTKPGYKPVGLRLLEQAQKKISLPIAAIGGINKDNIPGVKQAGAKIIATVRAVCQAKDISRAIKELNIV